MKFDYSRQFAMIEKVPNLTNTFAVLKPVSMACVYKIIYLILI